MCTVITKESRSHKQDRTLFMPCIYHIGCGSYTSDSSVIVMVSGLPDTLANASALARSSGDIFERSSSCCSLEASSNTRAAPSCRTRPAQRPLPVEQQRHPLHHGPAETRSHRREFAEDIAAPEAPSTTVGCKRNRRRGCPA